MTRLTNRLGLPQSIVNAVMNDPYTNSGTLSVTRLIAPAQMIRLTRARAGELEEDVADRLWALYGQLGHSIAERAAEIDDVVEHRVFATVDGHRTSGQFDLLSPNGILRDFKFTSVFAMKDREVKPEWVAQENLLRVLIEIADSCDPPADMSKWPKVNRLQIIAMARDWRPGEALRDSGYPDKAAVLEVPLWPFNEAYDYLCERVRQHTAEFPPPCTDEERWVSKPVWALKAKGQKRAIRLFDEKPETVTLAKDQFWEFRPGAYRRCESYCNAAPFCPQWQSERQRTKDVPGVRPGTEQDSRAEEDVPWTVPADRA
jgi:hypothetical protein